MRQPLLFAAFVLTAVPLAAAQHGDTDAERVVVTGGVNPGEHDDALEEEGGYGQPEWVDRSRVSVTTKVYVLNPYELFVGVRSETDFLNGHGTVADLTQEFEIGLPYRLELDLENEAGFARSHAADTSLSVGARYAFASWNKIPFNPTVEASYQFGIGGRLADRFESPGNSRKSDQYEARLLFGQEVFPLVRWGANVFFANDTDATHERQIGLTQDVTYLLVPDKVEAGVEMRYTNATRHADGRASANEFVIGPSVSWTPRASTFLSVAALFGSTGDSPRVGVLAAFAFEFGSGEGKSKPKTLDR